MKYKLLCLFAFVVSSHTLIASGEARLMRFPAIHGSQVAFSYAGDLYTVDINGGMARKLTTHVGYEMFPRYSPDGKHIAFTAQYDGNTEVYLIPSEGGKPRRLTYTATLSRDDISDRMGPNNIVMTWTNDGQHVVYRSRAKSYNPFIGHLYKVPIKGGMPERLPLSEGGFCSFSPDGKQLAFNRVFREFRTWKNYQGGMADDIHLLDLESKEVSRITGNAYQDIIPMWVGGSIFYLSDRDGTMNLFEYSISGKNTVKVTSFEEFDVKFPSTDGQGIVFENGGYLYRYDTKSGELLKMTIHISDDLVYSRDQWLEVGDKITGGSLSADAKRVVFSARGDIYNLPVEEGITFNISKTPGVHEREVIWSPTGEYIAYISDASGEYEIYIQKPDGSRPPVQLTTGSETYIYRIKWSPDGKKILWNDRELKLKYVDIESKKVALVCQSGVDIIEDFDWSPDSRWITYAEDTDNGNSVVRVFDTRDQSVHEITDPWYNSELPSFSDDGKYLVFVSKRYFTPRYSETEWNHIYENMSGIFLVLLSGHTLSPFDYTDPMLEKEKTRSHVEEKDVDIDFEGIQNRIETVPVNPSNYFSVECLDDKIYFTGSKDGINFGVYDLKDKQEHELGKGYYFAAYANSKKLFVRKGHTYAVLPLTTAPVSIDKSIDLGSMKVLTNYREEWQQIFDESWRQMRDFFYDENMHGLDWKAVYEKYLPLVEHVNHRDDLSYVIGEMIGELNAGHAYVKSGHKPEVKKIQTGLLGAEVEKHASGYFEVKKVLKGVSWDEKLRSPLDEAGVKVSEGNFLIALNGQDLKTVDDIFTLLVGKAGEKVMITVNSKPEKDGGWQEIIKPISDESELLYYNWVQENIKKVEEATGGEVGYLHVPDMGVHGLNEFAKYYYPQVNKKGIIIDNRGNGGGNVSTMIIERLNRKAVRARMKRNSSTPVSIPVNVMLGPKVMLIDKYSASDGDLFAYAFKKFNMGKVIGERTWGGVIGIQGTLPFIDGSSLNKPEYASYSIDKSEWIIEGYGVEPDIEVVNDPYKEFLGEDAQLDRAIKEILEEIETYKGIPPIPEPVDKSK